MALPAKLKPIGHYIKIANEHSERDPSVYYWCLLYAVQNGMKIDKKSPECIQYLTALLNTLEQVKKTLSTTESVTNELVAQAHIEQYALKLFVHADNEDRAGIFNKNVVKAFYTSGHLFDLLTIFGEIDEQLADHRKYAKWKAAYIHNCLKNGETPIPGPAASGQPEDQGQPSHPPAAGLGFENMDINQPPPAQTGSIFVPVPTAATHKPPQQVSAGPPSNALKSDAAAAANVSSEAFSEALRHCKYAISAIQYEDAPAAVENLKNALQLLQKGSI